VEYSDQGFEQFQVALKPFAESDPLLWRLRDSLYATLCYRMIGFSLEKRHIAGIWTWIPWAISKILRRVLLPSRPSEDSPFGFLFYGSHGAHFETLLPVVRETAQNHMVTAWCLALDPAQISRLGQVNNVRTAQLGNPLDQMRRKDIGRHAMAAIRLTSRLSKLLPSYRQELAAHRSLLIQVIFDYFVWKRFWLESGISKDLSAVFVTSEASPIAKGLIDAARDRGAKAVHLCHGLRHATHQVTRATDLCAFSEMDRQWFADRISETTVARAIGNPRIDSIRASIPPPRRRHNEPFRLLFLNSGIEDPYTPAMMEQDCKVLAINSVTRAKYLLRVRPHPRESATVLTRIFQKHGVHIDEFSSGSLSEDLEWCDAAATQCSTSLLEAAVTGRPCYWINARSDGLLGTGELQAAGIGRLIKSSNEWADAVNDLYVSRVSPPALIPDQILEKTRIANKTRQPWLDRLGILMHPSAETAK